MSSLTRRTQSQRAKREAVEAGILAAAEGLLTEGATYADLNVERIATRAGISRSAFYFYFRDKRELLLRLTEDVADLLHAEAERWWRPGAGADSGPEGLRLAVATIVGVYRDHAALLRAVVQTAAYDEAVGAFWRAVIARFIATTRERIEAEQAVGRVDAGIPAEPTAFALIWMTERACFQQGQDPDAGRDDAELLAALQGVWARTLYALG